MQKLLRRLLRFVQGKKFLYTVGTLAALFVLMNYVAMPLYVHQGRTLSVPRVIGLTIADARKSLDSAGLQPIEAETRPDPALAAGMITNQNPLPDAVVKKGRRVYLTISGGEIQVPVPMLRGKSTREASFALERYGLKLGPIQYQASDTFPENTIIAQSVAADSKVSKGTAVGITVSKGKAQQEASVPSLSGKSLAEAEKILHQAGLKVGNITYQPSFDLLPNTVVDQFPRPGEPSPSGQSVDLFVVGEGKPAEEIQAPKE